MLLRGSPHSLPTLGSLCPRRQAQVHFCLWPLRPYPTVFCVKMKNGLTIQAMSREELHRSILRPQREVVRRGRAQWPYPVVQKSWSIQEQQEMGKSHSSQYHFSHQQGAVGKLTPNFRVASPILLVATIRLRVGGSLMETAQMNHGLLCTLKGSHCRGKGQNGNVLFFIFIICK